MSGFDVVGERSPWTFNTTLGPEWRHESGEAVIRPGGLEVTMFEWTVCHNGNEHYSSSFTLDEAKERAETMLDTYRQLDEIKEML
jgi:hypothetical protein